MENDEAMEASAYTPPIVARLGRRGGTLDTSRWSVFPPVLWLDAKTFFFLDSPITPPCPSAESNNSHLSLIHPPSQA